MWAKKPTSSEKANELGIYHSNVMHPIRPFMLYLFASRDTVAFLLEVL